MGLSIKSILPTIARALGGPLAGLAVDVVGQALGLSEPTQEKIEELLRGPLNGDQIVALKIAENNLVVKLKELDIRLDELEVQDRTSARDREVKAGGVTTSGIAWVVVSAFVIMVFCILFMPDKIHMDTVLVGTVIGYLSAKSEQILSYYFGSSRGSDDKSQIIANMSGGNGK